MMNVASIGVSATSAAQATQTKEPSVIQIAAPENGQLRDTVEISPRRSHQSTMHQDTDRTVAMKASVLRRMAERMIKEQYTKGNHLFMLFYGNVAVQLDPSLRPDYHIPDLDIETSHQMVVNASQYFGPAETSARIFDTAIDIAGPDAAEPQPMMVNSFRRAVTAAFDSVTAMFDGVTPELTQRTYEATMQHFDNWAASGKALD